MLKCHDNANIKGKTLKCHDNANLKGKTLKCHDNANLKGYEQHQLHKNLATVSLTLGNKKCKYAR
jgi:hypothetical protein